MGRRHPWRALGHLRGVVVIWSEMHGRLGATDGRSRIWLDPRQLQAERRCTLAHELEHLHAGHGGCQPAHVERRIADRAARSLITLEQLIDAVVWARHEHEAAEDLWVDAATLRARLEGLRDDERARVEEALRAREGGA